MAVGRGTTTYPMTIADGQSTSGPSNLNGMSPKRIIIPAAVEGTHLTIEHGLEGEGGVITWYASRDDAGTLIAIPLVSGAALELSEALYRGAQHLRIRTLSNATGAAQVQSGDAAIVMVAV